ncbi:hypothetical protein ISF6_5126 [Piscinibacter sakaiensis]|uniref:Uncharacterized protein n=1 Tax=Piscinibacter sakaiensis TaxID=1547922 RepID=A0A0K8P7D9_PISS1|nr:hypothetical protein ISF6_5126 [Piscinibacter sakaiensis]
MGPSDRLALDGPDSFRSVETYQAALDAEIDAAGGLEAWRARAALSGE